MRYRVLNRLRHNGDRYDVGAELELSAEESAPLLRCQAVEALGKAPSTNNPVTESGKAKAPAAAGSNAAAVAELKTSATPRTTTAKSEGAKAKPPRGKAGTKPAAPPAA